HAPSAPRRSVRAARQAVAPRSEHQGPLDRLRDPRQVRRRLWHRLRPAQPQPRLYRRGAVHGVGVEAAKAIGGATVAKLTGFDVGSIRIVPPGCGGPRVWNDADRMTVGTGSACATGGVT